MGDLNGRKPLEVELWVCPRCENVGLRPSYSVGGTGMKHFCTGPAEEPHKKQKMEQRPFVEKVA